MKKLLYLITLIQLSALAQDSTSISFGTEAVQDFKRQSLMDEFDRAFGENKKVSNRLKAGLLDFPHSRYNPILPFIHVEQSIGKKLSLSVGGVLSTRENHFYRLGELGGTRLKDMKVSIFGEIRYYTKDNQSLSGNYISLEFKQYRKAGALKRGVISPYLSGAYYLDRQLSFNAGKQFGSVLDIGLQTGLKSIHKPELDKLGFVVWGGPPPRTLTPFIGLYSKTGLGIDFPFGKNRENKICEFLNCFTEFDHMLKVNLSNLFYIDPYIQNLKLDVAYEQKLWDLPLSVNLDAIARLNNERNHNPLGLKVFREGGSLSLPTYESHRSNQTLFDISSTLQMRYYFLQKRAIAKGRGVKNLSGVYAGAFYTQFLKMDDPLKYFRLSLNIVEAAPKHPRFTTGLVVGLQKKILQNYYYDFSIRYNAANQAYTLYSRFNQDIKLGYSF